MGSEMCIRDRLDSITIRSVPGQQEPYPPLVDVVANQTTLRLENCLLYTSDAADDLLCVDLGGRRIIKKKTT